MICPEDTSIQQALAKAKLEMNKMKMSGETFKNIFAKPIYDDVKSSQKPEKPKDEADEVKSTEFLANTPTLFTDTPNQDKDESTRAPSTESTQRSQKLNNSEGSREGPKASPAPKNNPEGNLRTQSVIENQPINNKNSPIKKKNEEVIEK